MADFNLNNADFYYTGSTGWFDDFCDKDLGNPSYLYVPVHDDQYNFTGVVGPWPYHNTELCIDRPPTPFFTGDGRCIGCPKIASDSQYLPHRLFNSTYISNEWENIYPTFEENVIPSIPFLQTGLNVSWVRPLVYMTGRMSASEEFGTREAAEYYGPEIDIVAPTAYIEGDYIVVPYWETNGAKIHVRYAIRGNNYARLVIGFTVEKVTNQDIEQNVNYIGNANSISVEDIINNYTYSLYYGYVNFGWSALGFNPGDFQLGSSIDKPVFIFDSCAVKNVGKELNIYGPAPGFHIRNNSTNLYTENGGFDNDNIFVRYFAFIKKEGDDEIDPLQIVRAKIDIAGFGHPKGLLGLYYDKDSYEEGANLGNQIQINRLGPYDLRKYSLNWGRGINTASTVLYDLNQYARLDFKHGFSFVTGGVETNKPGMIPLDENGDLIDELPGNVYNYVGNDYTECINGRFPECRYAEQPALWALLENLEGLTAECAWTEGDVTDFHKLCSDVGFSQLPLASAANASGQQSGSSLILNNNPNGCFDPILGRRGGYLSKEIFGTKEETFFIKFKYPRGSPPLPFRNPNIASPYENLDRYGVPEGVFERTRQKPIVSSLFSYSFNPQEDFINFRGYLIGAYGYMNYWSHEHPLFYIGQEQIFATEPNLIARVQKISDEDGVLYLNRYFCAFKTGAGAPGGYVHPYRKMIEFLDNFGINTGPSQPFIDPNSCIPKYIVTTPVSENINYYSGYVTTTEIFDSDAVSITGDNSIIVKQLGDIQLDMYNIADNNQIFNPVIISNTGLFKEDIDYIYPSNTGNFQGSPSKIIYDSGTNILYNLAPFFGYYKYNLNTKCTTYGDYLINSYGKRAGGDGGYADLIVTNSKIYISNLFQNRIDVINKGQETLAHTITDVESPVSMVLDGNRLYVGSSTSNYISIFDIQNYSLSGQINFLQNESPIKLEILNNKLYTLTNSVNPNKDIVIISGINSITGMYNTYSNTGYKRLSTVAPYSLSKIENNNYIYIGNISGIKIIDSNTDTYLNTVISGFASNIEIPDRFSDVLFSSVNEYRCNEMVFNDSDNKIYFIDKHLPAVFVLNTGTNECEKIIDLSALFGGAGGITFESNTNNMYISISDRITDGTLNSFVILNNRPKANISFSETPQFISQNTYNFNITSNNNQTGILYKSDQFPYISIDKTGSIILPTGALANNFDFLVFAGQVPTSGFAYSFDAQTYRIGSTGGTSVLYPYNGYSIYNPEPDPGELKFLKPTGQLLTGSRNCDFDDNCRVVVLDNWKNNSINIYNFNNNLLQSLTGLNNYVRQIQMNGDGSLFAFRSSIGTGASIQIVTGNPSLNGSYKIKQRIGNPDYNLVSGILPRLDNFVLNRSGNIIICEGQGVNNPGISGAIFTGSVNSQWGFHSYISGSHFTISNDGSVILSAQFREYHNSKLDGVNIFTGSINAGWKFKTALTGQIFNLPIQFEYPSFFIKNEDVIAVPSDQGVGYGFALDFFTGSKTGGWKLKEQSRISIGSHYIDISDDGRTVHRAPITSTPYYYSENLKTGYILSFSGSKESGWSNTYEGVPNPSYFSMPTTPSPSYPRFNSKIRCHRNVVVTYSDTYDLGIDALTPSPTSFFTYNI
jgi:hypothetical protein